MVKIIQNHNLLNNKETMLVKNSFYPFLYLNILAGIPSVASTKITSNIST